MAITPRHTPARGAAGSRLRRRGLRGLLAAGLTFGLLVGGAACGFDVQTNRPYTPAQGVNDNVGDPPVQVRNFMLLSRQNGTAYLSATITATDTDALIKVSGKPVKRDASFGKDFTVTQADPIGLAPGAIVILTQRPLIQLQSTDAEVGLEAEVTLTFSDAGELKRRVPIVNADEQPFATISPSATPSP